MYNHFRACSVNEKIWNIGIFFNVLINTIEMSCDALELCKLLILLTILVISGITKLVCQLPHELRNNCRLMVLQHLEILENLKIGWKHNLFSSLLFRVNLWQQQQQSKSTQNEISKFFSAVKFWSICLLCSKYLAWHCRTIKNLETTNVILLEPSLNDLVFLFQMDVLEIGKYVENLPKKI